jgi:dynein heavy chain, axonemal
LIGWLLLRFQEACEYPENGKFVHGLYIEGARWPTGEEAGEPYIIGKTPCAGVLVESKLKELMPLMPLIYIKAVPVQPEWEATEVGYIRHHPEIFECPVYTTTFRGPTYVFLSTLRSRDPAHKWIHAGVALVMQLDA